MTATELLERSAPAWTAGPSGCLLWLRLQLSRNLAGMHFPRAADAKGRSEALQKVKAAVERWNADGNDPLSGFAASGFSRNERELLEARRLLPAHFPDYHDQMMLFVDKKEELSLLANGFDHLRIQCMSGSRDAGRLWRKAAYLESVLGRTLSYAYDKEFGYLTASPYRTGTALRLSAALFLPGLVRSGALSRIADNAARLGFSLRSLYDEIDDEMPYCELTNTVTLGVSEKTLCERMDRLLKDIADAEALAWKNVFRDGEMKIRDSIWRALGTLKYARLIGRKETAACAGFLQIGGEENLFPMKDPLLFRKLLLTASPAYVREATHKEGLEGDEVDLWRAVLLRSLVTEAGF